MLERQAERPGAGSGKHFGGQQVVERLSTADDASHPSVDQDLGRAWARVVVGGEAHAVGPGVEKKGKIAGRHGREIPAAGEEVSRFADWTDYVHRVPGGRWRLDDGQDLVVGLVERRSDQIVHAGVSDDEGLVAVVFDIEDAGQERTGLGDEKAARFEEKMRLKAGEDGIEGVGVGSDLGCGIEVLRGSVLDAETATDVDIADVVSVAG